MMQLPIVIYQDEDGVFIGEIPTLKGVHSYGHNLLELRKNLTEAIELYFEEEKDEFIPQDYLFQTIDLPKNAKIKSRFRQKTVEMA
ncbi:type II toxin-antitoxin system HicB family antitoxin [Candidatus Harpocratesius sp.]